MNKANKIICLCLSIVNEGLKSGAFTNHIKQKEFKELLTVENITTVLDKMFDQEIRRETGDGID